MVRIFAISSTIWAGLTIIKLISQTRLSGGALVLHAGDVITGHHLGPVPPEQLASTAQPAAAQAGCHGVLAGSVSLQSDKAVEVG